MVVVLKPGIVGEGEEFHYYLVDPWELKVIASAISCNKKCQKETSSRQVM